MNGNICAEIETAIKKVCVKHKLTGGKLMPEILHAALAAIMENSGGMIAEDAKAMFVRLCNDELS